MRHDKTVLASMIYSLYAKRRDGKTIFNEEFCFPTYSLLFFISAYHFYVKKLDFFSSLSSKKNST